MGLLKNREDRHIDALFASVSFKNPAEIQAGAEFEDFRHEAIPGTLDYASGYELIPFVEIREGIVAGEIGFVEGSEIAIEIGGGVPGLAVGVVKHSHEMTAETLLQFEGGALVERIGSGGIEIVLEDKRIHEATEALWAAYNRYLAHVIAHLPESKSGIPCRIGSEEAVTLDFLAKDYVRHLLHHLRQIGAADSEYAAD